MCSIGRNFSSRYGTLKWLPARSPTGDRHVLELLGPLDRRIGPHVDRPGRFSVGVGDDAAHAGGCVADRAPLARALDHGLAFAFGVGLVLRPLEVVLALPARLRPAENLPVELDLQALVPEIAFFESHEVVQPHAFRGDLHADEALRHEWSPSRWLPGVFTTRYEEF
jgi:hypothetical protein